MMPCESREFDTFIGVRVAHFLKGFINTTALWVGLLLRLPVVQSGYLFVLGRSTSQVAIQHKLISSYSAAALECIEIACHKLFSGKSDSRQQF